MPGPRTGNTVTAVFPRDPHLPPGDPQPPADGAAAEAIRDAEFALARQGSVTAQVDLQMVTAVLTAHTVHAEGAAALEALQQEIESAVTTRTDLDTPAGARSFQRYLVDKLRDIREVIDGTGLDAASKASLTAAMASLYASSGQAEAAPPAAPAPERPADPEPPADPAAAAAGMPASPAEVPELSRLGSDPLPALESETLPPLEVPPAPAPMAQQPLAAPAVPPAPAGWGGAPGLPVAGAGLPSLPLPSLTGDLPGSGQFAEAAPPEPDAPSDGDPGSSDRETESSEADSEESGPSEGEPLTAPAVDRVITAAVSGTPIPEAFGQAGIEIPRAGTPVTDPVPADRVGAGDVGVFTDRHALALGNGRALLDDQIQPIDSVNRPGFLGWAHPPDLDRATVTETSAPEAPAPTRPAETTEGQE